MQGQGPQNLMNNIPRQTGNGQVQSFNQGSNALQNQRNLQISNQMLTQSQNIGQTLPMIQNSQTNNQQLQQPQLSGFQVQPQMQMQNQVNQQLFSKQIQTQSNVNQVNSAITQQGQGQSNTGRSQSQQQEASRIQNLLSQAFKPVQNNQVKGQMQNSSFAVDFVKYSVLSNFDSLFDCFEFFVYFHLDLAFPLFDYSADYLYLIDLRSG
jgi:hypothetical protein